MVSPLPSHVTHTQTPPTSSTNLRWSQALRSLTLPRIHCRPRGTLPLLARMVVTENHTPTSQTPEGVLGVEWVDAGAVYICVLLRSGLPVSIAP